MEIVVLHVQEERFGNLLLVVFVLQVISSLEQDVKRLIANNVNLSQIHYGMVINVCVMMDFKL